ncbi:MAG: hypothetical protein ACLTLQ_04725 [[Clostridium] scindens]
MARVLSMKVEVINSAKELEEIITRFMWSVFTVAGDEGNTGYIRIRGAVCSGRWLLLSRW